MENNKINSDEMHENTIEVKNDVQDQVIEKTNQVKQEEGVLKEETLQAQEPIQENRDTDEEPVVQQKEHKVKNYLEKPLTRKERRKKRKEDHQYEKKYHHKLFKSEARSLQIKSAIGLVSVILIVLFFRYFISIEIGEFFEGLIMPSYYLTGGLVLLAFIFIFTDRTMAASTADPITDYFIINRGKMSFKIKESYMNRINTRFMMVTLLKLYKKQQIAIVEGKIIYGTMDGPLAEDEVILLNFLLDHNITNLNDFVEEISEKVEKKRSILGKKEGLYTTYKETIVKMAESKAYINLGLTKAKWSLRIGAILLGLVVLALIATAQGSMAVLGIYALECFGLFVFSHIIFAHSKGAHQRVAQLRRNKRKLQSSKSDLYTALIYNYIFHKEAKVLKRIQKAYQLGQMTKLEYTKFSETYNGFNYMMDYLKKAS